MKEKVVWGLRILAIILAIVCVAAIVWYFWQKRELQNQSMDFLKQYNILAHPKEIYDKKKTEVTEEEVRQWKEKVNQQMSKFMEKDSKEYKRIYEEMKEIFLDEVKMNPDERVKSLKAKIKEKRSFHITSDTAEIVLLVEESSVKYGGEKGSTETEYTFIYIREDTRWVLIDLDIDLPML